MKFFLKTLVLLFLFPLYSGETLKYVVSFKRINVGEAIFKINEENFNNNILYHIESNIKSNKYLSYIYKLNDTVDIWVNSKNFSLIKVKKDIREGSYKNNYKAQINKNNELISNNIHLKLENNVYDPIALIYYLRKQNVLINQSIQLMTFDMDLMKEVKITRTDSDIITIPFGEFNCSVYRPSSIDDSPLFKEDGLMTIWFTDDSLKLPIQIKQSTNIGTITMKLVDRIEN